MLRVSLVSSLSELTTQAQSKDNHISGRLAELGFQNVRKKNANNLVEGNTLARIMGTYTTTTFRNNVISNAQNTAGAIYHSGIKEFPGSTGNVYENNKITRGRNKSLRGLSKITLKALLTPGQGFALVDLQEKGHHRDTEHTDDAQRKASPEFLERLRGVPEVLHTFSVPFIGT